MKLLVVGSGAREHALLWKLAQHVGVALYNYGPTLNPGIQNLTKEIGRGSVTDVTVVTAWAKQRGINIAWIGPEDPLAAGIVDALEAVGIRCIGPTQALAQLESSKGFTRQLVTKYHIDASPKYQVFTSLAGIAEFSASLRDNIVVKPDGLTGGKGVRVMGEHFQDRAGVLEYCEKLFTIGAKQIVIEEKLVGQEFSLMSFSDGKTLKHMPAVQDHKRAYEGDSGPNTGGMGSYSDTNHSLPFLTTADITAAEKINEQVVQALQQELDQEYKGIVYGGFIAVKNGVKLIEYNVRFGDPEVMNLITLLQTDLVTITQAILHQTLDQLDIHFTQQASVCKYVVPEGYPIKPVKDQLINVSAVDQTNVQLFYASVDQTVQGLLEKGSRTIAVVGKGNTLAEAEQNVEREIQKITGPVFHRSDIGTASLLRQRVDMMKKIRYN